MSNNKYDDFPARRRIDTVSLVIAVALLAVAGIGLGGETWWLVPNVLPWAVAAVVALVGLGLILSSLPRRRR